MGSMAANDHTRNGLSGGARWLAGILAALVLTLAALAASPTAHGELHRDSGHPDHDCAVTLFAHGAEPAPVAVFEIEQHSGRTLLASRAPEFFRLSEPAHLRPPAAGPPAG